MKILVTGGAGFIGSAVIRHIISNTSDSVVNVDKLTYAGNLESLAEVSQNSRYAFERVDICDRDQVDRVLREHQPDAIMHLAAESHVDRSISGRPNSSRPTSSVLTRCSKLPATTGQRWMMRVKPVSASTTFRLTKFTETSKVQKTSSLRPHLTSQARHTRPARLALITLFALGHAPMVCRHWLPTARTTTALATSLRS